MREVIIADNQDITNLGLRYVLSIQKRESISEASTKSELVELLKIHTNAVIILDYTLFNFSRVEELLNLHNRFENVDWILFSEELSDTFLNTLVVVNEIFSVVLKTDGITEIESALNAAFMKERYVSNKVLSQLLMSKKAVKKKEDSILTITEKEILKGIAEGKTTKMIAENRNLSFHTVITHRKNIFRKLEVNNIHEATKYAVRAGIIDVSDYYI